MLRRIGLISLCLSVLQGILDLTDRDGSVGTAAEVAMLAAVFGNGLPLANASRAKTPATADEPAGQDGASELLKALSQ